MKRGIKMGKDVSWLFDEKLSEKLSEEQKYMVIDTLTSLSCLSNPRVWWIHAKTNKEKSILENLKGIGMHSGEKRIGMGEFRLPSSFMALLQYEFMLKFLDEQEVSQSLKMAIEYGLRIIKRFRDYFDIPSFEREDDVLIVEVLEKEGEEGYVEDFEKIESIDDKYFVKRCMPSKPSSIGMKIQKWSGFMNTVGNTSKASKRIKEIYKINEPK